MVSMSLYLIGDLQGCNEPFQKLLAKIGFSPSRDTLYLLGDLVNRGPDSLGVLRSIVKLGDSARCLLGNHDLHLLAMWQNLRKPGRRDTAQQVLTAGDGPRLLDWLRHRSMAIQAHGWLMVHAGVLPQWSTARTMELAGEVEGALRGPDMKAFLQTMYGNEPARWSENLQGPERLRVIVNALTRIRFCTADGRMEFETTGGSTAAPNGYLPWYEAPDRATEDTPVAFGHWSTLGSEALQSGSGLVRNALPLDTGCVWGGCLTAARLGALPGEFEMISQRCDQQQKPVQKSPAPSGENSAQAL
jgi:bis(5'-nucleosyl)-tetraphosphatase (symmetrical)